MNPEQPAVDLPLTRFLPFRAHDYVEMAMMLADTLGEVQGKGRLRDTPDVSSTKIGVGVYEDVVFVDIFTEFFNGFENEFSVATRHHSTDVLVMGTLPHAGKFRVFFFVNPAIEDVVDARPEDRFTPHQVDAASLSDEFARLTEFEAADTTPSRLLAAANHVLQLFLDDAAAAVEVVDAETLTAVTFAGESAVADVVALSRASIAVTVPVLDDEIAALMDCLVGVPVDGVLFSQVSNPARIRSEGGEQTGNLLLLHAVPA